MDDDQQFCLRWNNHQSTLISVFDTLLENETLVDCTLAAEGRFMKAHKVVLSACSPYFATLLQQQYDKHPIFILKDVKYQELRAMMDYMYRGEVNISQDQLAALLKAAESLQIKGLSDNRSGGSGAGSAPRQEIPHQRASIPGGKHGYTLEQTKRARLGPGSGIEQQEIVSGSREGSSSPSRRRRKPRRRSIDNDVHDNSNSSANQQPNASLAGSAITASALASQMTAAAAAAAAASAVVSPAALASAVVSSQQQSGTQQQQAQLTTNVPKKTETIKGTTSDAMNNENIQATTSGTAIVGSGAAGVVIGGGAATATGGDEQDNADKVEQKSNHKQKSSNIGKDASTIPSGELTIEPKSEYDDEGNDENVEDLTLDEEEMGMDDLDHNAGTSQGGEGSSQGYAAWQHDNRSQDELLLTTQDAQQRDPQAGSVSPNNVQDTTAVAGGAMQEHESNAQFKYESKHCMDAYNSESLNFKYDESMQFKSDGGSGERFPCAVCGKSYLRKRHLQRHMRDECIGIPPRFSCDLCPSRFRRKYHMVRHLTSKHGIPPAIAQQTTGNSTRNGGGINNNGNGNANEGAAGGGGGAYNGSVNGTDSGCDSPLPENLSMRKENYEHELNLPSPVDMSNVGAVGGIVSAASPIPPAAHVQCPIPTYGLTGAITAISAAAAVVEEQAAAAAAAAAAGIKLEAGSDVLRVAGGIDGIANAENVVQPEIGATPAAVVDGAATGKTLNMMDDDWKMKLSLHLISNSLLKERLMNTMPFAYNNN